MLLLQVCPHAYRNAETVDLLLALLALGREEVMWYFKHTGDTPPPQLTQARAGGLCTLCDFVVP